MAITIKKELLPRAAQSCHASTVAVTSEGITAAWFAGTGEGAPDVGIYMSKRDGSGWSEPVRMSGEGGIACWNPVLYSEGGNVTLFYKQGEKISGWKTMVRRSKDGGISWDAAAELIDGDKGGRGPVKNKPVRLSDGGIIAGASHESADGKTWRAFADISRDGGYSWERSDYITPSPQARLIQPTIWESETGVHMLLRSDAGQIYRADSADKGRSWSEARPTAMPNNNSGIDLARLANGEIAMVCNPVSGNFAARTPLTLYYSRDDGESWDSGIDLEDKKGEYSYPAIIADGNRLYITYTYLRERIMFVEVSED